MPPIDRNDPEVSYRRGYEHGAKEVFHAVARFLDPATREILRTWVEEDVAARVASDTFEEHLEGDAIVQIFARMQFEA